MHYSTIQEVLNLLKVDYDILPDGKLFVVKGNERSITFPFEPDLTHEEMFNFMLCLGMEREKIVDAMIEAETGYKMTA